MSYPAISASSVQSVEKDAARLTVEKLKAVLRHHGLPLSGNKNVLISRIKDEIRRFSHAGNTAAFDNLRKTIHNPYTPPPAYAASPSPAYLKSAFDTSPSYSSSANIRRAPSAYASPASQLGSELGTEMTFTASPFHSVIEKVSPRIGLDAREGARDNKDSTFRVRGDVLERIRQDETLKILLYCATDEALRGPAHVAFPNSFEMKINGHEVKSNFRGLKNKPGTTLPVDVTSLLHKTSNQDNRVSTTWALTTRRFHVIFQLIRHSDSKKLTRKLREAKSISKASVIQEMSRWAEDSDIVATSSRMSLKCPLSTLRIQTPCRSKRCKHNQCFDAESFLLLQEQAPQWSCPVCNQHVPFDILQVDEYVDDILKNSPQTTEQVVVDPSGQWSLVSENGKVIEDSAAASTGRVKREASELSDDIVEIVGPANFAAIRTPSTSFSPFPHEDISRGAGGPPATSSGPNGSLKRPAPVVIDLTGDSDEDDDSPPIRPPAKRQITNDEGVSLFGTGLSQNSQMPGHRFSFPSARQRSSVSSEQAFPRR